MAIMEFGFGSGDIPGQGGKRLKLKEGEKYRISFLWWPGLEDGKPNLDAATPKFIGCNRLYLQGVGYFLDNGPGYAELAGGAAKLAIGTIVCQWPTDSKGAIDKTRFQDGEFSVMPWVLSKDKYRNIEQHHSEFPLGAHDLTLACTDTQYQKVTMAACRESLFRKLYESGKAEAIIKQAIEAAANLPRELAQNLTIAQINEKLGKASASPIAPKGGGASGGASGAEIESMLDDILK